MSLSVYFDGSYGPKFPHGTAAWGYVIKNEEGDTTYSAYGRVGSGPQYSCNVGEYSGLFHAMEYVHGKYPKEKVVFYGDSTLVINQMNGVAAVRKGLYIPYFQKAWALAADYVAAGLWSFEWVPRAMNSEADKLAQYQRSRE